MARGAWASPSGPDGVPSHLLKELAGPPLKDTDVAADRNQGGALHRPLTTVSGGACVESKVPAHTLDCLKDMAQRFTNLRVPWVPEVAK